MLIGTRYNTPPTEAPFVIILGQSNAVGYTVRQRLANTSYNYQGIAAGYPAVRVAQPQYAQTTVPGVKTYWKTNNPATDQSLNDGSWQDLTLGVNNCQNSGAFEGVGPELSLCTNLHQYTGKTVWLLKCAYPGTALTSTITPSNPPGNWNNTNRVIFIEYFVKRALTSFRAANPTLRPFLAAIHWHQGEHDAMNNISKATYKTQFASLRTYLENELFAQFVTPKDRKPIWNIVKLKFFENAAEGIINDALAEIVAEHDRSYLIDCTSYPQGDALTAGQASPINVGDPNSAGGNDNNHQSYIAQLAIGELAFDNLISADIL